MDGGAISKTNQESMTTAAKFLKTKIKFIK